MPSKRKMTISELPPKLVALAESDPSTFDQILSEEGIQLVPDAANALIPGKPVGADSPGAALINSDPGYHGALVQRSPRGEAVAKKVSKFAQGAIPGVAVGGPLGAVMGGAMNTWLGPEPESPRAFANMAASTVLGPLAGRVRAMLPDGSTATRVGRTIYDIIAGGGETAAADKLGDAMTGKGSDTSMAQYALGAALGKGAGLALTGTARAAASRMPESLRRKLGSVAQQLAGGVDEQAQQAEQRQIAMLEQKAAEGDATAKLFLAKLRGGAQPTQPVNLAGNVDLAQPPNPLTAKPVQPPVQQPPPNPLMAQPQPQPPQNPLIQPPTPQPQAPASNLGEESDLEKMLRLSLETKQRGATMQPPVPEAPAAPQRVRGVTNMAQNPMVKELQAQGYDLADIEKVLEQDRELRRRVSQTGTSKPVVPADDPFPGPIAEDIDLQRERAAYLKAKASEKGAITIPGEDIKAARNAMGEFFGGGAPPRTANVDPALAKRSYADYASSIGREYGDAVKDPKKAWAPTELDTLIEGKDVTNLPVALQSGSPEFKHAVRTRMTEKLLGAFDSFQKAGDEGLSVFDKFHEMRNADLGGGVTGGKVLRATFGNDAVQNIEHLYEALEKSKNLPSQNKDGHRYLNIQSLGNALRISIPSAGIGAFVSAHGGLLPAAATAGVAGTVINLGADAVGRMLGKTNSKFFQFLVDAVEGGSRFTPAMAAQYIAGLKQAADRVTDENGNPIQ